MGKVHKREDMVPGWIQIAPDVYLQKSSGYGKNCLALIINRLTPFKAYVTAYLSKKEAKTLINVVEKIIAEK